jgi:hypothetical protein
MPRTMHALIKSERADLAAQGIALMDGGDGTQWRPASYIEDATPA